MKIVYDGTEISSEKNIQDATIDYIYKKSNFFVNKPDYKPNIIIPDTLRQYFAKNSHNYLIFSKINIKKLG